MQITYIVGNGLDIQYGLKTRYRDFYEYQFENYEKKKNHNPKYRNYIYDDLFKDSNRESNYDDWSDFELALGQLTKNNNDITNNAENKEKFIDNLEEVIDDLRNYLKNVQNSFEVDNKHIDFIGSILKLQEDIPQAKKEILKNKLMEDRNTRDSISILTFNYTDVLDRLYEDSQKESSTSLRNTGFGFTVVAPAHAHGTLDFSATLGVSDETQISKLFTEEEQEYLIKQLVLSSSREQVDIQNENIIDSSDIIVIYGMSIGETDKYIWNKIANHSVKNNVPLIIYHYVENFDTGNPIKLNKLYKRFDNLFISRSGIDEDYKEQLKNNLITIIGKTIFEIIES